MITMNVDADTYIRWLSEIADLWFEKGGEPSIVRKRIGVTELRFSCGLAWELQRKRRRTHRGLRG